MRGMFYQYSSLSSLNFVLIIIQKMLIIWVICSMV